MLSMSVLSTVRMLQTDVVGLGKRHAISRTLSVAVAGWRSILEPDAHLLRACIDLVHKLDLAIFLLCVLLVDADGIDPRV